MKTVAFYTLGCKVNQYDTEAMSGLFRRRGYRVVGFDEQADVYVINTCTVTHVGDRKSRQAVRRAARTNPSAVIAVTGCYAQTAPEAVLDLEGVDVILGNDEEADIVDAVEQVGEHGGTVVKVGDIMRVKSFHSVPVDDFTGRTRATVKVQEGCNEYCTYCVIPFARGRQRSRHPEDIMREVRRLVDHGFREVVLTGIHLGSYGEDLAPATSLERLVDRLHGVKGLRRIRLSSLEPMGLTPEGIGRLARLPLLCHHLHLPLQSGSDEVLARMRRNYTTSEYRQLVEAAREFMPDVNITTDVMVGFPGETTGEFASGLDFIREIGFGRIHAFPYSRRKGTRAYYMEDQVAPEEKRRRQQLLLEVAAQSMEAFHRGFLGQTMEVLVEGEYGRKPGDRSGFSDNYIRVVFQGDGASEGDFVGVRLMEPEGEVVLGERVSAAFRGGEQND